MTTISLRQMAELEVTARERTCRRLAAHIDRHFPRSAQLAGADAVLDMGRGCLGQADELGLDSDGDLLRLLSLQLFFGHAFRTDSLCQPFAAILARVDITSPRTRIARSWQDGMSFFERIAGDCGQHQKAAIARLGGRYLHALAGDPSGLDAAQAGALMAWLWPQKHAALQQLGTGALTASLWQVAALAREHRVARPGAARVLLVLGYVFGSGFGTDPMLAPLAGLATALGADTDAQETAAALARADDYLSRIIERAAAPAPARAENAA
jgi:hypothetical protein